MIYEHFAHGGWVGFDTRFVKELGKRIPRLGVGIKQKDGEIKVSCVLLIHKTTEILPDLYKAISHYLGHRGNALTNTTAYFQHEQETFTN